MISVCTPEKNRVDTRTHGALSPDSNKDEHAARDLQVGSAARMVDGGVGLEQQQSLHLGRNSDVHHSERHQPMLSHVRPIVGVV